MEDDKEQKYLRTLAKASAKIKELLGQINALTEPIAVIGMGCRFPGGANDPDAFWDLLENGVDAIGEIPPNRWPLARYYDPDPTAPGKIYTKYGGFLDGEIDRFDGQFFGISPLEARSLDPQQRLLLEVSWEALECAGADPGDLKGTRTGVFIGMCSNDYFQAHIGSGDPNKIDEYSATGVAFSSAAGRLSYFYDLHGPSMTIDTACSSSLVTLHLAAQSLRSRESDLALAGGVTLILTPEPYIGFSKLNALAPDGRCRAFDEGAGGYVKGEGCGLLVLKRLSDAQTDGDPILALLKGSAVNQDGKSSGLTAPNALSQKSVIQEALKNANLSPENVDYIEAHGTGTSLGDPIEVRALSLVFQNRRNEDKLLIGSVKTNIGHLEAAAGIAGVIKVILAMQHGKIPKTLHFQNPSGHIPWETSPVTVAAEPVPWPDRGVSRIAGVSSFGFSGTNAHIILQEAAAVDTEQIRSPEGPPVHLLTLSAKNEAALMHLADRYQSCLSGPSCHRMEDVCFTANTGRAHFKHRLGLMGAKTEDFVDMLSDYSNGRHPPGLVQLPPQHRNHPSGSGVVFLFTGQGSQYPGMGRALYRAWPLFRKTVDQCGEILREHGIDLIDLLFEQPSGESRLNQTAHTQPALFALEYALAQLWMSWGVRPAAALGHSIGEYAAACVAGVFSLEDGLNLAAVRGKLIQSLPGNGMMAAVAADQETVSTAMKSDSGKVSIAAVNAPGEVVISGDRKAVQAVLAALETRGIRHTVLRVSHAFHSHLMEPILDGLHKAFSRVDLSPPRFPVVSNSTGRIANKKDITTPDYWIRHTCETVRFQDAVRTLDEDGYELFLEVGPHAVLTGLGKRCVPQRNGVWFPSLIRGEDGCGQMLDTLARLYVRGVAVDWQAFHAPYPRKKVPLPPYPFQRQRFWMNPIRETTVCEPPDISPAADAFPEPEDTGGKRNTRGAPAIPADAVLESTIERIISKQIQVMAEQLSVFEQGIQHIGSNAQISQASLEGPVAPPPSPENIQAHLRPEMESAGNRIRPYGALLPRLETLSVAYVLNALEKMGWRWQRGVRFSTEEAVRRLGIVPHLFRLAHRLLTILEEEKIIGCLDDGWEVLKVPEIPHAQTVIHDLSERYSFAHIELTVLNRCGNRLAEVLRGEVDPLELLFPGEGVSVAQMYQDSPVSREFNVLIRKTILYAVDGMNRSQRIRILEIGAGTGGTTAALLPHLPPERTEYVFTDKSEFFLDYGREKLKAFSFVRYQPLDIEKSPENQGFKPFSHDIVLAANVLHATKNIKESLRNVHRLIRPGGLLVLLEVNEPRRFLDLIFGLTAEWWRFSDHPLRSDHPLLSVEQWQTVLQDEGFNQTSILSFDDLENPLALSQAVFLSRHSI